MKIKLQHTGECCDCGWEGEWIEGGISDFEVEIPDAVVKDWRETLAHLAELETYFDERVKPQIDAEYERRRAEREKAHPEEARVNHEWSRHLLEEFMKHTVSFKWLSKF
jgi:hypothetical protein